MQNLTQNSDAQYSPDFEAAYRRAYSQDHPEEENSSEEFSHETMLINHQYRHQISDPGSGPITYPYYTYKNGIKKLSGYFIDSATGQYRWVSKSLGKSHRILGTRGYFLVCSCEISCPNFSRISMKLTCISANTCLPNHFIAKYPTRQKDTPKDRKVSLKIEF